MAKADRRTGKYEQYFGHPDDIKDGMCVIPDGTKMIGHKAFMNCAELKEVVIPESVEVINTFAFFGCTALTRIILPSSVDVIDCWDPQGVSCISLSDPYTSPIDLLVDGYRARLKKNGWFEEEILRCN